MRWALTVRSSGSPGPAPSKKTVVGYWQAGAANQQATRIELGGQGATEADLTPDDLRRRMWWRKAFANFRSNIKTFGLVDLMASLPDCDGLGPWFELPDHLR